PLELVPAPLEVGQQDVRPRADEQRADRGVQVVVVLLVEVQEPGPRVSAQRARQALPVAADQGGVVARELLQGLDRAGQAGQLEAPRRRGGLAAAAGGGGGRRGGPGPGGGRGGAHPR